MGEKMVKHCRVCGFENIDADIFCVNCGKRLDDVDSTKSKLENKDMNQNTNNNPQLNNNRNSEPSNDQSSLSVPQKYESYEITDETQCIYCKQNSFIHLNKKSFLSDKWVYFCTNCGLTLEKHWNQFKLIDISNKDSRIWQLYNNQTLNKEEWERIADGGLSDKEIEERDKQLALEREHALELQRQNEMETVIQAFSNGEIKLTAINSPIILKKNEEAYLSLPNIKLSEPRSVRISQSGGFGTSYRVAKGFTLHSGTGRSRSVSHEEIMEIDDGTLVFTNKRLIFAGNKKSVNIDLKKILAINVFKDGISIQRENKQKIEYFTGTNRTSVDMNLGGRHHQLALEGPVIKAIILGQISNLG